MCVCGGGGGKCVSYVFINLVSNRVDLTYAVTYYVVMYVFTTSYSPATELTFIGKKDTEVTCALTLTNTSDRCVLYKVHKHSQTISHVIQ